MLDDIMQKLVQCFSDRRCVVFAFVFHVFFLLLLDTIRYDTIEEINVDSKAEYTA